MKKDVVASAMQSGGVINGLLATATGMPEPQIGMGVTRCIGSDRYPGTILGISKSGKKIGVASDDYEIVSGSYGSEVYKITPAAAEDGKGLSYYTRRQDGRFREVGGSMNCVPLRIGDRSVYRDPSF
jgi:hypothetical protein